MGVPIFLVIFGWWKQPWHTMAIGGQPLAQRFREKKTTDNRVTHRAQRPVRKATGDWHHVRVPRPEQCSAEEISGFWWLFVGTCWNYWLFDGYLMVIWWLTALMGQHCCMGFTGPVVQPVALAEGERGSTDTQSHTYHWKILAREPNIQPQKHMVMLLAVQR